MGRAGGVFRATAGLRERVEQLEQQVAALSEELRAFKAKLGE